MPRATAALATAAVASLVAGSLAALAGCGDNVYPVGPPLAPGANLTIIAHQDDDLLFMQPDLYQAVVSGAGVTNVYVTAGNGTEGTAYAETRYAGLRASYAAATGADYSAWVCGLITIAGHVAQHCRLDAQKMSLVFLAYPDGGKEGQEPDSLLNLWEGNITTATTVAEQSAVYDQPGLIATIAEIITATVPTTIRTLEVASTHGRDHSDHMIVGALAMMGVGAAASTAQIVSYRGYNTEDEPVNQLTALYNRSAGILEHYDACTSNCPASCGDPCPMLNDPTHATWLSRRYAVGMRLGPLTGVLTDGSSCAKADADGTVTLVACDPLPPAWTFEANGTVQIDATHCLQELPTGELGTGDCAPGEARSFRFDDEGHVWTATAPVPIPGMDYAHAQCLVSGGGNVRAALCGSTVAPIWGLRRALVSTARAAIGVTAAGRAVRLGDVTGDHFADLCTVGAGGLLCAAGDGTGNFAAATRLDNPLAPLAIEPTSLALGDLDGDGLIDACGRDLGGAGILCATAASGYSAALFSDAFAATGASNAADRSLAIADGKLCGFAPAGITCVTPAAPDVPVVTSIWPQPNDPVWIGDLDGDGAPDWCTPNAAGPSCSVATDAALTTDGESWAFSLNGVIEGGSIEGPLADDTTATLADVSGDGRADLCTLLGDQVGCAMSTGHGFGPRTDMLELADGTDPESMWLGDLDGDGKADICIATPTTISCALTP